MKKIFTVVLTCAMIVALLTGVSLTAGAAGYDGKTGYVKVWDFETWELGAIGANAGDTAVSPIRGNGGYTSTITDEWNYTGGAGKSIKFDSATAMTGCIQFDHKRPDVFFGDTAYNAMLFAVKVPAAPTTGANEKGYSIQFDLNDWGVYYKTLNEADVFQVQHKGSEYWTDISIQDDRFYVPYGFEGIIKFDMAILYKDNLPAEPTATDYDNSRLEDFEIQHEVVIEMWLADSTGGEQGAFYLDDMYLRTGDATDTFEYEPEAGPRELNDFEDFEVGESLFDSGAPEGDGSAFWETYGYTATASDMFVGNGSIAAEFSSATNRQTWGILALLKTGAGNLQDKDYIVMHVATPSEESSKSAAYEDANGNRRFAFAILPKAVISSAGHWFKTNTTVPGNVQMMADGEATWKSVPGDDFYNYLPFGWSGWLIYRIDAFAEGTLVLGGADPISGIEVYTSQAGGNFGKVYLDSFFAIDGEDELESGISVSGNKYGTDPDTSESSDPESSGEESSDIYVPSYPDDVETGDTIIIIPIILAFLSMVAVVMIKKRKLYHGDK